MQATPPPAPARRPPASVDETVGIVEQAAQGFVEHLPILGLALFVIVLAYALGRLASVGVQAALRRHDPTLARMVGALTQGTAVVLGLFVAMWIVFPTINFREILASLGVTGLILGFALRDIIENFVAGILILWRRPFRVGDQIRSGVFEGTVREINFRSTILETYEGIQVFIPNGRVFTEPVENFTGYAARRIEVVLGISQQASIDLARRVIVHALKEVDGVLAEPAPVVLLEKVSEFTNDLHVLVWTRPPTRMSERTTRSDVTERLYAALAEAGIEIPYPIQTVRLIGSTSDEHDRR